MYQEHYNLRIMPFEANPDPRFIWLSEKHKEALDFLKYGIQRNIGFLLLTGDIGTGKTLIINCLLNGLDNNIAVVNVTNPRVAPVDFFNIIAAKLGWEKRFNTKGKFLLDFENYLYQIHSGNKKIVLIIDEAHNIKDQVLEEIRLLSNIELEYQKLLNIFFVGQNEFYELILDEQNKALRQRIAVHYNIEALTEPETSNYIKHRLDISGSKEEIFSPEAIYEIFSFSKGYPRLINAICDRAMLTGYVLDTKKIDDKIVKKCVDALIIPGERKDAYKTDLLKREVGSNKKILFTRIRKIKKIFGYKKT